MSMIDAADLSIHYDDVRDGDASPVLLLHGWPDDASTWDRVAASIADA